MKSDCERRQVMLDEIDLDRGIQVREDVRQEVVDEYTQLYIDRADLPPIRLWKVRRVGLVLTDGHYRVRAARLAGLNLIPAEIRTGTWQDALLDACGANATHGQPRTSADKRKAVLRALRDPDIAQRSDRDIAKACVVSHPMVAKYRKELETAVPEVETLPLAAAEPQKARTSERQERAPTRSEAESEPEVELESEVDSGAVQEPLNYDLIMAALVEARRRCDCTDHIFFALAGEALGNYRQEVLG